MIFYNKLILITLLYLNSSTVFAINNTDFLNSVEHQFWFDINDVPSIELVFDETQWQLLLTSTPSEREEVSGKLIYVKNNKTYSLDNIGIKVSGNTSFILPEADDDTYVQANFTLDFDEFVDDQTLSGISALKLKRFHNDPSFVREPLSNQIMQNFNVWTTHSSTYVKVSITVGERQTAYYGVYRMNESVNRHEYLDKRFGLDNDGGFLWQGNYKSFGPAHFSSITQSWGGVGDFDEASFEYKGKGKKYDEAHAQLVDFAKNVTQLEGSEFEAYADEHINIDLLLKGLASESVLGHWDGFWGNGNNYFVYFDESQIMHFIPYDTDNTFGTSAIINDSGLQDTINFASSDKAPLLVKKILAIDKHLQRYKSFIDALVTQPNLMVESYAIPWIERIHPLINNEVDNDTGDNTVIEDQPASWGNQPQYRIFQVDSGRNWYQERLTTVNKALGNTSVIYNNIYYRGVTNQWQSTLMTQVSANIWTITVNNNQSSNSEGEPRFKFDIYADWTENYGDDNRDGKLTLNGDSILFSEGFGEYIITLNIIEKSYFIEKVIETPVEAPIIEVPIVTPTDNETPLLYKPTADAGDDIKVLAGETVHFGGRNSVDVDGNITSYIWSNDLVGASVFSVYSEAGIYEVILTVIDNDNQTSTDSIVITVIDNTVAPPLVEEKEKEQIKENKSSGGAAYWLLMFVFVRVLTPLLMRSLVKHKT